MASTSAVQDAAPAAVSDDVTQPIDLDASPDASLEPALGLEELRAIRSNSTTAVSQLLDKKPELLNAVDPGAKATPVHWAALESNVNMLEDLYKRGARFDAHSGHTGMTPLHYACSVGNLQVAQFLVCTAGCATDARDTTGATPLMIAAQHNWPRVVFWLAQHSPDGLALADRDGDTALHWAGYKGALACLTLLVDFGLSPLAPDRYGATVLHLAVARNCEPNVRWLLQHPEANAMLAATDK